jgi:hypothetical protein
MAEQRTIDNMKDLGSGVKAPESVRSLYHIAFDKFKTRALWNWREIDEPTIAQALTIADSLRLEGDLNARKLAFEIEGACRAAL